MNWAFVYFNLFGLVTWKVFEVIKTLFETYTSYLDFELEGVSSVPPLLTDRLSKLHD